jgi:hypothetical protein
VTAETNSDQTSWLRIFEAAVTFSVATGTECNQILHYIPAESASGPDMVNLQVLHRTAVLAPPTISFQNLSS